MSRSTRGRSSNLPGPDHRKNKLPHGICRVRMRRGTDAWYRTLAWIDVVATASAGQTQA